MPENNETYHSSPETHDQPSAVPPNAASAGSVSQTAAESRPVWKDLSVPVSIIIAGMFIGAGLYFGNIGSSPAAPVAGNQAAEPAQQANGNTDNVNPVTEDDHIKGSIDAPITIVEYSDFDCPFCSRFHDTMNEIVAERDDVAWVYRHFPLEQLHPQAPAVAVASECVATLGGEDAFWNFTDNYFADRGSGIDTPHAELIPELVAEAGVDVDAFTSCFENGETIEDVNEDFQNAAETGGRGTPWSVLIGPTGKTYPINGAVPRQTVEQLIEAALAEA